VSVSDSPCSAPEPTALGPRHVFFDFDTMFRHLSTRIVRRMLDSLELSVEDDDAALTLDDLALQLLSEDNACLDDDADEAGAQSVLEVIAGDLYTDVNTLYWAMTCVKLCLKEGAKVLPVRKDASQKEIVKVAGKILRNFAEMPCEQEERAERVETDFSVNLVRTALKARAAVDYVGPVDVLV
jgi:hypothetical protein